MEKTTTESLCKNLLIALGMFAVLALAGCAEPGEAPDAESPEMADAAMPAAESEAQADDASTELRAIADAAIAHLIDSSPYLQLLEGRRIESLSDNSFAYVQAEARRAGFELEKLLAIDVLQLSEDDRITYAMLDSLFQSATSYPEHFWHNFNVTPYAASGVFSSVLPGAFAGYSFETEDDGSAYLALLRDLARYLNDDLIRLQGQEERGILLPKPAIPGVRKVFGGLRAGIGDLVAIAPERLTAYSDEQRNSFEATIELAVKEEIVPAIDALLEYLGDDYAARAPQAVGLSQYPGGEAAYRYAIRQQTTLDLHPDDIHQRGLAYMADVQEQMRSIRDELGFHGSAQEFHEQMRADPRFFAKTPEEVEARYMAYVREIEPHIADYFSTQPQAPYGVRRLDPAAEPGMTFGYYQPPNPTNERGEYRYNGSKLESRPMVWTGPLIFHELIPGHHFHIALQRENETSPKLRKLSSLFYAAFTEGWANYAASLALEMGILDDPYERYGWLLFDAFVTNRLVVDTGMNHLGWSREKATAYMLANTFSSEEETATETLRYSTDMPAQALAYKVGLEYIRALRAVQEAKLGDAFDLRTFHAAVLGAGTMPLGVLREHVDRYMERH